MPKNKFLNLPVRKYIEHRGKKNKKLQSVCRTYIKLTLKMHSNIQWVQTNTV